MNTYERGYVDALQDYAYSSSEPWAENGVQYVGTTGKKLRDAIDEFLKTNERGRCNGWTNYETWSVNLWLTNDEETYLQVGTLLREKRRATLVSLEDVVERGTLSAKDHVRIAQADALKEYVTEYVEAGLRREGSLASQLLGAALSEVDWDEIVKGWSE